VQLLQQRGMTVAAPETAEFYLRHLNYYRLAAYWLPFESDHQSHRFRAGTTFEQVLNLYVFDRELRLLVLDAIERIEVSMRARWAYELAHRHGPYAHLDPFLTRNPHHWTSNLENLKREVDRADETFIRHLREKSVPRQLLQKVQQFRSREAKRLPIPFLWRIFVSGPRNMT